MKIHITWGTGQGPTRQAAFDNALLDAGIGNYNIIRLSSIIPEGSEIVEEKLNWNEQEHGHKLYAVISDAYTGKAGESAVAGLGWVWEESGKGLFLEITGKTRKEVTDAIEKSLGYMKAARSGSYGDANVKVAEVQCTSGISCAVVAGVFRTEGWE